MRRNLAWTVVKIGGVILLVLATLDWFFIFSLTGRILPDCHIERLERPVKLREWNSRSLVLVDGRTVLMPELALVPPTSRSIQNATANGVEINKNGRVYGLVHVWHWCGNDPMWFDYRRVDIAHLATFIGRWHEKPVPWNELPRPMMKGGAFGDHGWNVSEAGRFRKFERLRFGAFGQ